LSLTCHLPVVITCSVQVKDSEAGAASTHQGVTLPAKQSSSSSSSTGRWTQLPASSIPILLVVCFKDLVIVHSLCWKVKWIVKSARKTRVDVSWWNF